MGGVGAIDNKWNLPLVFRMSLITVFTIICTLSENEQKINVGR